MEALMSLIRNLTGGEDRAQYLAALDENLKRSVAKARSVADQVSTDSERRAIKSKAQRKRVEKSISAVDALIRAIRFGQRERS